MRSSLWRGSSALLSLAALVVTGCTDAGLYAAGEGGPSGPDRSEFKGTVCVPLASGEAFPVKVLFAVEGGAGVDRAIVGKTVEALTAVTTQFSDQNITFSVIGYHAIAQGFLGSFARDERVAQSIAQYNAFQQTGPVSHRAPLKLAQSIISGDMQTGCRGQVARTRYFIVLILASADTSCANPVFNAGIDDQCNRLLPDEAQCSSCELARVTEELKAIGKKYGAGEVTIQPVFVTDAPMPDVTARYQAAAIARAGGTELKQATSDNVEDVLTSLNYASLQRALKLKRLVAMNRNALSRNSEVLVDSDGDGVSDLQEGEIGTDATLTDTDFDGISDGVEVKMGLKPMVILDAAGAPTGENIDVIKGCNYANDEDGDRLNDCEERVLGTDSCITDTDGDGLPDLAEFLGGSNPLIAEDLADDDRDGLPNVGEITKHTDPISADIAFQQERGYGYAVKEVAPTADGRACYELDIYNVTVVGTQKRPSPDGTGLVIPQGTNDIYIYFQVGRDNDPRGTGIGSLFVPQIRFTPPATRKPRGIVTFTPDDFVTGL
ncbi:MAG: calcium-binding protein [Myxococcales bacterium]|nr:calcium-binding protein [Myxococcales bacterium]